MWDEMFPVGGGQDSKIRVGIEPQEITVNRFSIYGRDFNFASCPMAIELADCAVEPFFEHGVVSMGQRVENNDREGVKVRDDR